MAKYKSTIAVILAILLTWWICSMQTRLKDFQENATLRQKNKSLTIKLKTYDEIFECGIIREQLGLNGGEGG